MKDIALSFPGPQGTSTSFPIPTVIQHIDKIAGPFGMGILVFGTYVLITATIVIALGFLIWGGVSWSMSEGDKTKLQTARHTVIYAIVGIVISFLSFMIINFIGYFFLGPNVNLFGK